MEIDDVKFVCVWVHLLDKDGFVQVKLNHFIPIGALLSSVFLDGSFLNL